MKNGIGARWYLCTDSLDEPSQIIDEAFDPGIFFGTLNEVTIFQDIACHVVNDRIDFDVISDIITFGCGICIF